MKNIHQQLDPTRNQEFSWLRAGLFSFYKLFQCNSANSAFLRGTFQNCFRNPAEPFTAEICVSVICVKIADGQYNPFGILLPVCKAKTDHIGYHLKRDIVQIGLFQALGDIIRQEIFFRPKRSSFKSVSENIIKAQRPCAFCIERKNRNLKLTYLLLPLMGKAAGDLITRFLRIDTRTASVWDERKGRLLSRHTEFCCGRGNSRTGI